MPPSLRCLFLLALVLSLHGPVAAQEPPSELAQKLAAVKFEKYAEAPGYSEGPTWRKGEVFFCSGPLWRVDAAKKVHRFLEVGPAGTVLKADGHLLICDNKHQALLDLSPEGKVAVVAERWEMAPLASLNDLSLDARGNVYWTDPANSSAANPVGNLFRLRVDGRVERIATGLAFPNGLEVDPASEHLYVIESQSKKILRYKLPPDNDVLGPAEVFYDLGGSGGDGCAFDAAGNLWVADFHRPETNAGRITVLSPAGKVLAYLPVPAKVVSNIAFGGPNHDEIFCTTGDPPGVFHAKVGVKGFAGHPGKPLPIVRMLNAVAIQDHPDAKAVRAGLEVVAKAEGKEGIETALQEASAKLTDRKLAADLVALAPEIANAQARVARDRALLAEIKRLGGKATSEAFAQTWLREIAGDEALPFFQRITDIDVNERTDGHKEPTPKPLKDRVTDDWLKQLAGQDHLRRLEVSGTAVTSDGLVHLKDLKNLERLNVCLTAVSDRGFEHLAGLTKMRRMTVCSSHITGSGFAHLGGMQQLESINLHSSPASDEGLAAIGKLPSLQRLEIVHTGVTDAGLAHLAGLANLRQLHVHGKGTTEAAFPFLGKLAELYQLDIYDRAASNATLEQIAKLPKLRMLMLVGGVFDDGGVAHLAKLSLLEDLSLDSSQLTEASLATLGQLKRLRTLHLGRLKLSDAGRAKLKEMLPRTVVTP